MPTVFLSYRHENSTPEERVRQLALRLRASGLDVILDQLANEEKFHRGGPPEGWGRWSMKPSRRRRSSAYRGERQLVPVLSQGGTSWSRPRRGG